MEVVGRASSGIRELAVPRQQRATASGALTSLGAMRQEVIWDHEAARDMTRRAPACWPPGSSGRLWDGSLSSPVTAARRSPPSAPAASLSPGSARRACRGHRAIRPDDRAATHQGRRDRNPALSRRPSRAASPGTDEREAAAEEVRIVEPGLEPGFLRGGHHSRGDQRSCHGCNAEPVELR